MFRSMTQSRTCPNKYCWYKLIQGQPEEKDQGAVNKEQKRLDWLTGYILPSVIEIELKTEVKGGRSSFQPRRNPISHAPRGERESADGHRSSQLNSMVGKRYRQWWTQNLSTGCQRKILVMLSAPQENEPFSFDSSASWKIASGRIE